MTWPSTRFPTALEIRDRLREFAGDVRFSSSCAVADVAEPTNGGQLANYVRVGRLAAGPPERKRVLFIGGVHAREWAPPTALTNLVSLLLNAKVASTPITIGSATWSVADVQSIFDNIDLFIAPMINPDGYDFSRTTDTGLADRRRRGWRKNRKPAPATLPPGCTAARAIGVDVNRNFDVLWDFDKFYIDPSVVNSSKNPCDLTFTGFVPGVNENAFSEPEARNVRSLLGNDPQFFVDVHMFGPDVLFSWGIEENDPIPGPTPVLNPGRVRDGTIPAADPLFNGYKEPINQDFRNEVEALASLMADATDLATGNRYSPHQGALPDSISGASDDYAFSRNLGTPKPPIKAFTLECGKSFLPTFDTEFPDIQREVHAALLALLRNAAKPPLSAAPKSCWSCSC